MLVSLTLIGSCLAIPAVVRWNPVGALGAILGISLIGLVLLRFQWSDPTPPARTLLVSGLEAGGAAMGALLLGMLSQGVITQVGLLQIGALGLLALCLHMGLGAAQAGWVKTARATTALIIIAYLLIAYLLIQAGGFRRPVLTALACLAGANLHIIGRLRYDPRADYRQTARRWIAAIYLAVVAIQISTALI